MEKILIGSVISDSSRKNTIIELGEDIYNIFKTVFNTIYSIDIKNVTCSLVAKEFFQFTREQFGKDIYTNTDKRKASQLERDYIEKGIQTIIFDFNIKDTSIIPSEFLIELSNNSVNKDDYFCFQIIYKELNKEYRKILSQDLVELSVVYRDFIKENSESEFSRLIFGGDKSQTSISPYTANYFRNITNIPFFLRDYLINDEFSTTAIPKYQYGNPYTARVACESDIINYYINDPYRMASYGYYQYQKEEIYSFIKVYKELREYYYRVLLNESFILEKEYSGYEKMFLSFWAIERFLNLKLETSKDIDSFDQTDIDNFLKTYGMGSLAGLAIENSYYLEDIVKNVLKNYLQLSQNKGSRKIFDILIKAFSLEEASLEIYKVILTRIINEEGNPDFVFIKANFNNSNVLEEIVENLENQTSLEAFVESDIYWDPNNTPIEELEKANFNYANTKYIIPEFTVDIGKNYIFTHAIFAVIEALYSIIEKYGKILFEDKRVSIADLSSSEFTLINTGLAQSVKITEALDIIKYLYKEFLKKIFSKHFKEDEDLLDYDEYYNEIFKVSSAYKFTFPYEDFKNFYILKETDGEYYYDVNNSKIEEIFMNIYYKYSNLDIKTMKKFFDGFKLFYNVFLIVEEDKLEDDKYKYSLLGKSKQDLWNTSISEMLGKTVASTTDEKFFSELFNNILYTVASFIDDGVTDYWYDPSFSSETSQDEDNRAERNPSSLSKSQIYKNMIFEEMLFTPSSKQTKNVTNTSLHDILYHNNFEIEKYLDKSQLQSLTSIMEGIVRGCKDLTKFLTFDGVINSEILITLSESEKGLIEFLKRCIEFFISFTSQMYKLTYRNIYATKTEMISHIDDVGIVINNKQIDSLFLDEEVSADIIESSNITSNDIGNIDIAGYEYIEKNNIYVFKYNFSNIIIGQSLCEDVELFIDTLNNKYIGEIILDTDTKEITKVIYICKLNTLSYKLIFLINTGIVDGIMLVPDNQ